MRLLSLVCLLLSLADMACGQSPWPVRVLSYHFGTSQTIGQDAQYFPANVLGPLTSPTGPTSPASSPTQVVSLGKGGYIALEFDPPISDGPGPDFTVFENAFNYTGGVYDEWMMVAASADGTTWYTFPYDSLTGQGMAGRTPTAVSGTNYLDPTVSGGDTFDLAKVGLAQARYIRVTDATQFQANAIPARLSADLDGIANLHAWPVGVHPPVSGVARVWAYGGQLLAESPSGLDVLSLYDAQGQLLARFTALGSGLQAVSPPQPLPAGVYIVQAVKGGQMASQRVFIAE